MSYFGKFWLKGPDAQVYLILLPVRHGIKPFHSFLFFPKAAADWVFSNKVNASVGKTIYTCMLNKRAGIEADLTVSVAGTPSASEIFYYFCFEL